MRSSSLWAEATDATQSSIRAAARIINFAISAPRIACQLAVARNERSLAGGTNDGQWHGEAWRGWHLHQAAAPAQGGGSLARAAAVICSLPRRAPRPRVPRRAGPSARG